MRRSKQAYTNFSPKMTTMQRQAQGAFLSDEGCFDMWHDYMNLARLLKSPCGRREVNHRGAERPKEEAPWSHIQTSPREDGNNSPDTSSVSSPSDTSSSSSSSRTSSDYCRFCKQNGESAMVYRSHKLKADDGKVICPILWNYTCPICEATGEHAHTRRYCPQARRQDAAKALPRSRVW